MNKITAIISIIVIAAAAFFGGVFYGGQNRQNNNRQFAGGNFVGFGQGSGQMNGTRGARGFGGNALAGEIISLGQSSLTIKLRDGGSKIVLFTGSTPIQKVASGTPQDLVTGKSIMVSGQANSDGSLTANNIQIRPELGNSIKRQ